MVKRPVWVEVNLKDLQHNIRCIGKKLPWHTEIMAVVKQNAYGHGLLEVARSLSQLGIDHFGVASIEEALLLRKKGIEGNIYILGCVLPEQVPYVLDHNLRIFITDIQIAYALHKAAAARKRIVPVHLKIDTGMGRIGIWYQHAHKLIDYVVSRRNLFIEGIATHFPSADTDDGFTRTQIKRLIEITKSARQRKVNIPLVHCANSLGALKFTEARFNMVRIGLLMYGINPSRKYDLVKKLSLKPVLSLKSRIVFLKTVGRGMSVSYGRTYVASSRRIIGTVACGYADGYPWNSKHAEVLVRGKKVPVIGRVCMDQFMIDVSAVPLVKRGDSVTIIGTEKNKHITAEDIAAWSGTIPYQITTCLSQSLPRIYSENK